MKTIPKLYERKEDCCGCTACYAICPKRAIEMKEDEEGFDYPRIDENKCVRCGMCLSVCPIKDALPLDVEKNFTERDNLDYQPDTRPIKVNAP